MSSPQSPRFIAAVAARRDGANAVWQSIGSFTSKQAATTACMGMAAIPHDAFTVLPDNSPSPMLALITGRKPIAPFYVRQDTFYCDIGDNHAGDVEFTAFVLPPHCLKPTTHELSSEYLMLAPCRTTEAAQAAAKTFCDAHGWQPLHENGREPVAQQVIQAILTYPEKRDCPKKG